MTNVLKKLNRISNTDTYQIGSLLTWSIIYSAPRIIGFRVKYHFGD